MEEKYKFDRLRAWIKAEYDQETKKIEDSLSRDGSFDPGRIDSAALFQRIQSKIREKERAMGKTGPRKRRCKAGRYQVKKRAVFFLVIIAGIFLATMTGGDSGSYLMYKMQYLAGHEIVLNEGNEAEKNSITVKQEKEQQIRNEIESELGILVPAFQYELELCADEAYSIQYGKSVAAIEYQYYDTIVNLRMYNTNRTDISGIDFQGKIIERLKLKKGAINMFVKEVKAPEDKEATLAARWEYEGGYYQLSGKVKREEFIKILKSITY